MVARACGNMGATNIALINPELWPHNYPKHAGADPAARYVEKALATATSAGKTIIENISVFGSLDEALGKGTLSFGTTARTGGWRQDVISPARAAEAAAAHLREGGRVSFVFGPEDKGLDNEAIEKCSHLVNIPTATEPSLNIAQAALVLLYELARVMPFTVAQGPQRAGKIKSRPFMTHEQGELLVSHIREAMLAIDSLPKDNSSYFMLPLRRLLARCRLRHNEFAILMGICANIMRLAGKGKKKNQ